ncbi:hypothetical protein NRIC_27910 [Enterococcus florum]|uniref:Uncharacterized protein n=1 Tax=Enterococcus florum TaxID=2480627 RepID=A0A4P5PAB9_9ENTE|nr:hypothetical protein [Enterococcus florum]GCF94900.1 hypothetical protein NRIC_27910 [Enterococcus florum]
MSITKKWLLFWGILGVLFVGMFAIVLTGNFPQFTIPFSVFASDDQGQQEEVLPKLPSLALKEVNDQNLLSDQMAIVEKLNRELQDAESLATSQDLDHSLQMVFGDTGDEKGVFSLYRKIYPVISSEEAEFVQISLLGFGQKLQGETTVTTQRQLWTFTKTDGSRQDYQVDLSYDSKALKTIAAGDAADPNALTITTGDTYLDKSADFETTWTDMADNSSDTRLYQEMKKAGLDPNQIEFQALEKEIPIKVKDGFFELFSAARGDLHHAYLSEFFHSNTPTDGATEYTFNVPTSEKDVASFKVSYDRLKQTITSITKEQ